MSSGGTISSLTTGTVTNTTVNLVWSGSYNTVSVSQSQDNSTYTTVASDITDASYTVTGLTTNTLYYFIVTAYDSSGNEGTSKSSFATTDYDIEITSFYAGLPTTTTIPLFWSGSYYKVEIYYRNTGDDASYVYLETVTGKPSYTITSLVEDTSYDFQLIPYNMADEEGTTSDAITVATDYTPYITTFSLATTASTTATLSWTGKFSYVTIQKSIDNSHFATDTRMVGSSSISTDGSFSITSLSPYYDYYFRAIPYSNCYNPGSVTSSVYGKTLMGISAFSNDTPQTTSVALNWTGIYTRLKIYKTVNNNTFVVADLSNTTTNTTSASYTVNSLDPYTDYSFYLQPYNGTTKTTVSDTLSLTTDFSGEVNIVVKNVDLSSAAIPLTFDTSGVISPYYESALIQISEDGGTTYTDVSLITQTTSVTSKYTYTVANLTADTSYIIHVLPYSLYGVSGEDVYKTVATKGYISAANVYLDADEQIVLDCSGVYTTTRIQYFADGSTSDVTEITVGASEYPYTISTISSDDAYYFRIYPVNQFDVSGTPSTLLYNPVITQFYLSSISSSTATASWSGNYDKVLLQYSTYDNSGVFVDISLCSGSSLSFDASSAYTTAYYRIVPYGATDLSGRVTDTIYLPVITNLNLTSISRYDISMSWTGVYDTMKLQYSTSSSSSGFSDLYTISTAQTDISATNMLDLNTTVLTTLDASATTYYFRAIPYSTGYGTTTQTTGISSLSTVYNATITSLIASAPSSVSPTNAITLTYTGTFEYAELFYHSDGSDYTSEYIELSSGDTSTTIYGLSPDTTYYFHIIPYNAQYVAGVTSQEASQTTKSIIDYLYLTYDASNSAATSIQFYWTNVYYDYIDIYSSDGAFLTRIYSTDDSYFNSASYQTLSPDETYVYTLIIYDDYGSETTTITTYTAASINDLGITSSPYETGITFTWTNTGYTTFSIQNSSTGSDTSTYTDDAGASTYYDSYSDEYYSGVASKNLVPNTEYDYIFTVTNQQGVSVSETVTVTTLAQVDFRFVNSGTNLITTSSIPIQVCGMFSGAAIYIDDGTGTYGNTVTISNSAMPVNSMPFDMMYFYPFNQDFYNYSAGYSSDDALDYNSIAISTADKMVGLASLYLVASNKQYLQLTAAAGSTSGLTVAFWFKSNSSGSGAKVFDFTGTDGTTRLYCDVGSSNTTQISYTNSSGTQTLLDLATAYNDNTWRHMAIVFWESLSKWEVYINGSKTATQTSAEFPSLTTSFTNYIGRSSNVTDSYYNGYIDDFRVYNSSLSSTAVSYLVSMAEYDVSLNAVNGASMIAEANKTYYVKIAGINGAGDYSTTTSSQSAKTLGEITSFSFVGSDSSSVYMSWDGSYSYVILESATDSVFSANYTSDTYSTTASTYNKGGLQSNYTYYFRVTPVNQPISADVSGDTYVGGNTTTLGQITSFAVTGGLSNSISLAWDGSFSYVALKQSSDSGSSYNLLSNYYTGKTATISDLSANSTYYYTIIPINTADVSAGAYSTAISGTTLGSISTVYASDISSTTVSLALSGSYVSSYYADISGGGSNGYDTSSNLTTSSPLLVTGLTPNTVYDFRINAFNNTAGTGTAVQKTLTGTKTLAYIGSIDLSAISYNTVRVTLNNSYYSSFYVYNGSTYSSLYTSSPVDISGLSANTVYDITVYAYKSSTGTGTYVSKTSSSTTLAYIKDISAVNISATSFGVALSNGSVYSSYKVQYTSATDASTTTTSVSTTSPISITGLSPNTVYTVMVYAYYTNVGTGTATTKTMSNTVTTLGQITSFYTYSPLSTIDSSSVTLYWDGSFASVGLESATSSDFGTNLTSTRVSRSTGGTYTVSGLAANTKYYWRVTPIISQTYRGGIDTSGTTVTNDVSGTTLPTISTFAVSSSISDISADTIGLVWNGSFSYITIQQSTDNFASNISTLATQYTNKTTYITGLSANTKYYYRARATNSVGVSSAIVSSITSATTRGAITAFYYVGTDSSSVTLYWDGSFASVGLERATSADFGKNLTSTRVSQSVGGTYTVSSLSANTKYYYRVTPINKPYGSGTNDVSGNTVKNDVSGTTLGTIKSFAITSADVSSNSVPLTWDGSFVAVAIYQSTDRGASYVTTSGSPFSGNSATITGLLANQSYYFQIVPINSTGLTAAAYATIPSTTTLAYIKDFSATTIAATSMTFTLTDSSYSSFKIGYRQTSASSLSYTSLYTYPTSTATISSLTENTSYYFKVYTYNNTAGTGTAVTSDLSDVVTLPTITSAVIYNSTTDLSSGYFTATINGSYTSFRVTYTKDDITYTQGYYNYIDTNTVTISDLSANTTYYYTVYVNNRSDGAGTDVSETYSATTLGSTPSFNLTSSPAGTNTMTFNIYSGDYKTIFIQTATDANMTSVLYTQYITNDDIASVYNNVYTQTGLSENTDYYFNCTPINSLDVSGTASTTLHATTLGNIYLGNVTSYNSISTSSMPIQWTGTYNTLLVEYAPYSSGSIGTYSTFSTETGNSSSNALVRGNTITGLSPNTQYAFRLTPYNNQSTAGTSYVLTDTSAVTLARVLSMNLAARYDTSASFLVDGSMTALYVYSSPASVTNTYSYTSGGVSTGTDISGLSANTSYVFYFAAINSIGVYNPIGLSRNPVDASYSFYTWPKIYGVNYVDSSANVIDLSLSGAFSTYDISYSSDSGATYSSAGAGLTTKKPIVSGLAVNTGYVFKLSPYNTTSGLRGYNYVTTTMYTDPSISYVGVSSTTTDTITLSVS